MAEREAPDGEDRLALALIDNGSELAGAAAGAALGLLGGPVASIGGASAGVMLTRALKRVGAELSERLLGSRQRVRVGAAYAFALGEIKRRLDKGEQPRWDWTHTGQDRSRPDAEEVLEGVLLGAAEAWEERKVRHLGLLYAELAFLPFPSEYCHYLVTVARRLTWRQLQFIAVLALDDLPAFRLFEDSAMHTSLESGAEAELDELGQIGLVGFRQDTGELARPSSTLGGGRMWGMSIAKVRLTPLGSTLAHAMKLDALAGDELRAIVDQLGGGNAMMDREFRESDESSES